jgi:hypothetical protein
MHAVWQLNKALILHQLKELDPGDESHPKMFLPHQHLFHMSNLLNQKLPLIQLRPYLRSTSQLLKLL